MPRQNRVTPFGDLLAVPARGTLMGNRGCLHDAQGRIKRSWRLTAWIYCLLEFNGRKRAVMSPGKYTELFFLDEASALAAGHRPCFECQRARYTEFMQRWGAANAGLLGGEKPRAPAVDAVLQRERIRAGGEKVKWRTPVGELPVGSFVELEGRSQAWVVVDRGEAVSVRAWSADGYKEVANLAPVEVVSVLTPASVVKAIAQGFVPRIA